MLIKFKIKMVLCLLCCLNPLQYANASKQSTTGDDPSSNKNSKITSADDARVPSSRRLNKRDLSRNSNESLSRSSSAYLTSSFRAQVDSVLKSYVETDDTYDQPLTATTQQEEPKSEIKMKKKSNYKSKSLSNMEMEKILPPELAPEVDTKKKFPAVGKASTGSNINLPEYTGSRDKKNKAKKGKEHVEIEKNISPDLEKNRSENYNNPALVQRAKSERFGLKPEIEKLGMQEHTFSPPPFKRLQKPIRPPKYPTPKDRSRVSNMISEESQANISPRNSGEQEEKRRAKPFARGFSPSKSTEKSSKNILEDITYYHESIQKTTGSSSEIEEVFDEPSSSKSQSGDTSSFRLAKKKSWDVEKTSKLNSPGVNIQSVKKNDNNPLEYVNEGTKSSTAKEKGKQIAYDPRFIETFINIPSKCMLSESADISDNILNGRPTKSESNKFERMQKFFLSSEDKSDIKKYPRKTDHEFAGSTPRLTRQQSEAIENHLNKQFRELGAKENEYCKVDLDRNENETVVTSFNFLNLNRKWFNKSPDTKPEKPSSIWANPKEVEEKYKDYRNSLVKYVQIIIRFIRKRPLRQWNWAVRPIFCQCVAEAEYFKANDFRYPDPKIDQNMKEINTFYMVHYEFQVKTVQFSEIDALPLTEVVLGCPYVVEKNTEPKKTQELESFYVSGGLINESVFVFIKHADSDFLKVVAHVVFTDEQWAHLNLCKNKKSKDKKVK